MTSYVQLTRRRDGVCRYPDTKDGNVDAGDDECSAPFEFKDCRSMFGDDGDSVDDDL